MSTPPGLAEDGSFFLLMEDLNEATPATSYPGCKPGRPSGNARSRTPSRGILGERR
ncbi:MAG: hypothetical protein R3D83_01290 [Caenibius sp.]